MPVKFIDNAQKGVHPSKTGLKLIKNVTPNYGKMILYRTPKKFSIKGAVKKVTNFINDATDKINNSIEDAFKNNIDVWVARCYFTKPRSFVNSEYAFATLSQQYLFGCVKLTRDTFWAFKNLTNEEPDADFVSIDDFYILGKNGRIKEINKNIQRRNGTVYFNKSEIGQLLPGESIALLNSNTNLSDYLPGDKKMSIEHIRKLFKFYSTVSIYNDR
jgi:hypothetical protein